jgi:hypothetical protein
MPNREPLRVRSSRAHFSRHTSGESDADGWVLIAFCVVGFATTIFFVFLSSTIAHALAG